MKNLISLVIVILLFAFSILAQENHPQLFDEFDYPLSNDSLLFRVHNLSIEVNKTPNAKALVRISGGNKNYFALPYIRGSLIKSVWQNNLEQPAEKLLIQFCDVTGETDFTRFFIVRENNTIKNCNENLITPKETVLFETSFFEVTDFQTPEVNFKAYEDENVSPEGSAGNYSKLGINVLKDSLKASPESKVYLIAYIQTNFEEDENGKIIIGKPSSLDKKSFAAKMFRAARRELLKNGFSPAQIVTIDGGYLNGNSRRLQFWFVPQGGAIPKTKPDYVPTKRRNK